MNDFDYLRLDGRSLRTFLTVLEEGSVSRAAERLGITQSAVSHTLDKLRRIIGDPLFVRSGRGIMPTTRAAALRYPASEALDALKGLTSERSFDPTNESMEFIVAANDYQRELVFPALLRDLYAEEIDARFRFVPGGVPSANLLHEARCHFVVTPFPPKGTNIVGTVLLEDEMVCFYDGAVRDAPSTSREFYNSEYADVIFPDYLSATSALDAAARSELDTPRISVPNFGDLGAMMKGTSLITAQTQTMALNVLSNLNWAPLPFSNKPMTLYLAWHRRDHSDPAHQWLRGRIESQAKIAASSVRPN